MDLYILDENLDTIGIVDNIVSVIWTPRYVDMGDFEVYGPATQTNIDLLTRGRYVKRLDDEMVGIIQSIELTTDVENGNMILVKGPDLKDILKRRIIWPVIQLNDFLHDAIQRLINYTIINPALSSRKISNFIVSDDKPLNLDVVKQQITGDNLLDAISSLCIAQGCGFKVIIENKNFVFKLYKGYIRTGMIFSPEFDNLANSDYLYDSTSYANVAYVAGEGEGLDRKMLTVNLPGNVGIDRKEIFVDARDLQSETSEGEVIPTEEYEAMLRERGKEKLAENVTTETFQGEVINEYTYKYKTDYFLGDIVKVENEFGMKAQARITEIIESEDATGHKIIPTFEDWREIEWQ